MLASETRCCDTLMSQTHHQALRKAKAWNGRVDSSKVALDTFSLGKMQGHHNLSVCRKSTLFHIPDMCYIAHDPDKRLYEYQ